MAHAARQPDRLVGRDHERTVFRRHHQHSVNGVDHLVPIMRVLREFVPGRDGLRAHGDGARRQDAGWSGYGYPGHVTSNWPIFYINWQSVERQPGSALISVEVEGWRQPRISRGAPARSVSPLRQERSMAEFDSRGLGISTESPQAAGYYRDGVDLLLSTWPRADDALRLAIDHDHEFALAHAALARLHAVRSEPAEARARIATAQEIVARNGSPREI